MAKKDNRVKSTKTQGELKLIEQSWSEVDAIYDSIAQGIIEIAQNINNAVRMIAQYGYGNNKELIITTKGLERDLLEISGDLKKIKERHADQSGVISTEEEFTLSLSVFSDYHVLSDRFKSVVFSPMLTITEFMSEVMEAEKNKLQQEQTTTVEGAHVEA